ncbi:hypothetical protein MO973_40715 [Paenibacillus sp. TRM 82003]|nr:hypothetical protein [Kineococcus sp. TRM81007]MCI2237371.1 hypothetical protein [Kineococcus sp. TRM81007]MCI3926522.1 hypothetical protein [Paenibacillus sp. TRM 82003]
MLRHLRGPDGGPSRGTRLVTVVLVVALLGAAATALLPVLSWLLGVL